MPHDNTAHEHLDRPDTLKRDLALACCLVETQSRAELVLADGLGMINLVSENQEGNLAELLHAQERIKLGLGFEKTLMVFAVDQEDNSGDLGEVVLPETAG